MDGSVDASDLHLQCGIWGLRKWSNGLTQLFMRFGGQWESVGLFGSDDLQQLDDLIQRWQVLREKQWREERG